ncbi:helix-turn-helix domain-containing protein [Paenibacillus sophorae]|uniref:Helix-turn-helix transcriptional regulator n=1 Tax=Paenibacillus sophorae TaxID=1333845 RepID=A0ABX8H7Y6_9BACL|nr:helix-turn-helix transcriptional regulator [Paenibacillus sophorae]QWU14350.1 helix-turn-helix transcriptional regulator [Paenibacillus sophorae]
MSSVEILLNDILDRKDISRRELSRRTKIRQSTINEMCNNTIKRLPLENIALICDELEIEIHELLRLKKIDSNVKTPD